MSIDKRKAYCIYALIILLQIAVIIYWGCQKTNYFIDEFLSMGYARGFTGNEPTARYITESSEWTYNEWHNNLEFKSQLLISDNAKIWNAPILDSLKGFILGRNYFGLLNLFESIFGFRAISNWPAVVLNIFLLILSEVGLLSLLSKLSVDYIPRFLALSLFGFSAFFISTALYVRFYMLVTALFIFMLNMFYRFWMAEKLKDIIIYEIGIFALAYFTLKSTELIGPFFGCVSLCLIVALVFNKRLKQLIVYCVGCLGGVIYIFLFTDYIQTILSPEGKSGLVADIVSSINEDTIEFMKTYREWELDIITDLLFGHTRIFLGTLALVTGYTLWKKRRIFTKKEFSNSLFISTFDIAMFILWLAIYRISVYRNKGVVISKGILILVIAWLIINTLWKKVSLKGKRIGADATYIIVLMASAVLYSIFTSLPNLRIWRYYCFVMVIIPIALFYAVDRLLKKEGLKELYKGWYAILILSTIAIAISPFIRRNIFYIYEEDKRFEINVREYEDKDVILLCRPGHGQNNQYIYDYINIMPEEAHVYLVNMNEYEFKTIDFTGEFVIWDHQGEDCQEVLDDLINSGYEIESLDKNHISKAYLCKKK